LLRGVDVFDMAKINDSETLSPKQQL